jgi:nucleolar protein 16
MGNRRAPILRNSKNRINRMKRKEKSRILGALETHCPMLTLNWTKSKSLTENYKQLGLTSNPNANTAQEIEAEKCKSLGLDHQSLVMISDSASDVQLSSDLESIRNIEILPYQVKSLPVWEQACLKQLISKYGNDYEAMQRDIKVNRYQWTARQLEKRIELYNKLLEI